LSPLPLLATVLGVTSGAVVSVPLFGGPFGSTRTVGTVIEHDPSTGIVVQISALPTLEVAAGPDDPLEELFDSQLDPNSE
jgi:hypothetical protein